MGEVCGGRAQNRVRIGPDGVRSVVSFDQRLTHNHNLSSIR